MASHKILVLGLGNTILGDDGVGIRVVREMRRLWAGDPSVELVEASLGGMVLLDLITGFDKVIVVDAIMAEDRKPAGFVYDLSLDDLGALVVPYASHALDLKTTIELGRRLGYKMPATVAIHAVKIEENTLFTEELSPTVAAVVPLLAKRIIQDLDGPHS
ncbi:MAG: hydrogenase maturation protease [Syntrophorhabdales bacterium]|jgi:hydrogenase maturation protease